MWRLSHEKRVSLIDCLVEGNSMRATARICKVGLNTVVRFLREIGPLADQYHHENIRGVVAKRVQLDEIRAFVAAKAKRAQELRKAGAGDLWLWTALDPDRVVPVRSPERQDVRRLHDGP